MDLPRIRGSFANVTSGLRPIKATASDPNDLSPLLKEMQVGVFRLDWKLVTIRIGQSQTTTTDYAREKLTNFQRVARLYDGNLH
jgi:hypothetical protein